MELFSESLTTLERALDLRTINQRIIAGNLANIDTPGYTARQLDFETSMTNALNDVENPAVVELSNAPALSLDGNNVDLENELDQMTQNKVMYSVTAQIISAKLRQISEAISQSQ